MSASNVRLSYAHLHSASNSFFIPGFGNSKARFEIKPLDQAGQKAEDITLVDGAMVKITLLNKDQKPVTFLCSVTNFDILVPSER